MAREDLINFFTGQLATKYRDSQVTYTRVLTELNQQDTLFQDRFIYLLKQGSGDALGNMVVDVVEKRIVELARDRVTTLLADGSLSEAELNELIGGG